MFSICSRELLRDVPESHAPLQLLCPPQWNLVPADLAGESLEAGLCESMEDAVGTVCAALL